MASVNPAKPKHSSIKKKADRSELDDDRLIETLDEEVKSMKDNPLALDIDVDMHSPKSLRGYKVKPVERFNLSRHK